MTDIGRSTDSSQLGEIFGQLREINDRLARIETTQTLVGQEHERRLMLLEARPEKILTVAATVSAVMSVLVAGIVWLIEKVK